MPAEQFRIDYAMSLVNKFAPGGHGKGFARIDRADVVEGMRARIADPTRVDQKAASLCGPAAFFFCVLEEHPELYAQYVIDLYLTGEARIGALHVKPSSGCRAYNSPRDLIHPVDWIALASLRDSENTLLDYSSANDTAAGITMPHSLADWFRKIGWKGVSNTTNVFFTKGRSDIDVCIRDFNADRRICLFINMQMLDSHKRGDRSFSPDHWVAMSEADRVKKPIIRNGKIELGVYSWGDLHDIPEHGDFLLDKFYHNFYGYVSATPTY